MKLTEADPFYVSEEIGTPKDYTDDMYKVYFEVADVKEKIFNIRATCRFQ